MRNIFSKKYVVNVFKNNNINEVFIQLAYSKGIEYLIGVTCFSNGKGWNIMVKTICYENNRRIVIKRTNIWESNRMGIILVIVLLGINSIMWYYFNIIR